MAESPSLFPFGRPVLPRPPSSAESRPVYVLGAYPSGFHVRWTAPPLPGLGNRTVRALLVDNEPTPFWSGDGEDDLFLDWQARVGWNDAWGQASAPVPGTNGPSGTWVEGQVLRPLRVDRSGACISDCLDTARLNTSQGARVEDTYTPVAEKLGLSRCTVPHVPAGEPGIVREAGAGHLPRLRAEIERCRPDLVVTLGNAGLRVLAKLVDEAWSGPRKLDQNRYGERIAARLGGRSLDVLPLVHPRSGERTPPWPAVHRRWVESRQD